MFINPATLFPRSLYCLLLPPSSWLREGKAEERGGRTQQINLSPSSSFPLSRMEDGGGGGGGKKYTHNYDEVPSHPLAPSPPFGDGDDPCNGPRHTGSGEKFASDIHTRFGRRNPVPGTLLSVGETPTTIFSPSSPTLCQPFSPLPREVCVWI